MLFLPVFIIISFIVITRCETFHCTDSFAAYKARNPELVRNGRVTCFNCGATSIWPKRISRHIFSHTCRTCGTHLYSSSSDQKKNSAINSQFLIGGYQRNYSHRQQRIFLLLGSMVVLNVCARLFGTSDIVAYINYHSVYACILLSIALLFFILKVILKAIFSRKLALPSSCK